MGLAWFLASAVMVGSAQSGVEPPTAAPADMRAVAQLMRDRVVSAVPAAPACVVLTGDPRSFIEAVAQTGGRLPVVLDDGSDAAREDIARLVRGLSRNRATGTIPLLQFRAADTAWPDAPAQRRDLLIGALHRAWKATSAEGYLEALRGRPAGVLGVVVTDPADPASLGALALAASRGQLLAFVDAPASVRDEWTLDKAQLLSKQVTDQLSAQGVKFDSLGDEIDAFTLVMNAGPKLLVKAGDGVPTAQPLVCRPGEYLALTDVLGRSGPQLGQRWAFCGQLTGSAAGAIYRTMAGVFTPGAGPALPWVFDAYPADKQFDEYRAARTLSVLDAARARAPWGFEPAQGLSGEKASLSNWRQLALGADGARGLDASLIIVGTMGNWDFFQLRPGNGAPGDVPILRQPALVYFVHSWSLQFGDRPVSVGGRWLAHGAYAYVGSVHEPFLAAFVPPHLVAQRLAAGVPLGMAIRHDQVPLSAVWRVGLMGDPLVNLVPLVAPPSAVSSTDAGAIGAAVGLAGATLAGATLASADLAALLKARDFTASVRLMTLLGRDADVARLLAALLREQPNDVTPALARQSAMSCYRAGSTQTFLDVATIALGARSEPLNPEPLDAERDPGRAEIADALWHVLGTRTEAGVSAQQARTLGANIRPWCLQRDAFEAARAVLKHEGKPGAERVFERARSLTKRPEILKQIDEARAALLK